MNELKPDSVPLSQPIFFPVSVTKFIVMDLATFGLYQIFWAFKSWNYLAGVGHRVRPGWRAWFSYFYMYPLLKEILEHGNAVGLTKAYSATGIFVTWLLLQISARLPDPFWIVSLLSFAPMLAVVKYVSDVNSCTGKSDAINCKFSKINWCGIVIGFGLLAVAVWSAVAPH